MSAFDWLRAGGAGLRFASMAVWVGGDSAGGTLAALACQRLRDQGSDALSALQILAYVDTDLDCTRASMREKGTGWGRYATLVHADQDAADAEHLRSTGVPTTFRCESGLNHIFLIVDEQSMACTDAGARLAGDSGCRLADQ